MTTYRGGIDCVILVHRIFAELIHFRCIGCTAVAEGVSVAVVPLRAVNRRVERVRYVVIPLLHVLLGNGTMVGGGDGGAGGDGDDDDEARAQR